MVFLILDGFAGHKTEMVEETLMESGAFEIVLPPHSSDQIQPLDLGMFTIQKMESHPISAHVNPNCQTRKLLKMFCGWKRRGMERGRKRACL
jgi:hypothetical protein